MAKGTQDAVATMGLDVEDFEKVLNRVISVELKKLNEAAAKTSKSVKGISESSSVAAKALSGFRNVLGALGVSLGLASLIAFGKSLVGFGADLSDTSKVVDTSVEGLQRMEFAFSKLGVSSGDTRQALHVIAVTLKEASEGSEDAARKLEELGVSADQIADPLTTADSLLSTISDHAKENKDSTDELRRVTNLFGDDLGRKLKPALEEGSAKLKELGDQAPIVSDAMAKAAKSADETLARWSTSIKVWAVDAIEWVAKVAKAFDESIKKKHTGYLFGNAKVEGEEDAFLAKRSEEHNAVVPKSLGGEGKPKETETKSTFEDVANKVQAAAQAEAKQQSAAEKTATAEKTITHEKKEQKKHAVDLVASADAYLDAETKLAGLTLPERIRGQQKLVNEHQKLLDQLSFEEARGKNANVRKEKELRLQIAINEQQQRAARIQQYLLTPRERHEQTRSENRLKRAENALKARDKQRADSANRGAYGRVSSVDRTLRAATSGTAQYNSLVTKEIKADKISLPMR